MDYPRLENLQLNPPLNPIARTILQGVNDENSPFSKLNGIPHVLQMIWRYLIATLKQHIKFEPSWIDLVEDRADQIEPDMTVCGYMECPFVQIHFPATDNDININMMPFIMSKSFEETKLPDYLLEYFVDMLCPIFNFSQGMSVELGKVGYLTIHESCVYEGKSHRRPGLHTESPGIIHVKNGLSDQQCRELYIEKGSGSSEDFPWVVSWGRPGLYGELFYPTGGIYMASTEPNSCAVWDCQIIPNEKGEEVIGKHGDIEHIRNLLPEPKIMEPEILYWITDRTPHESLPLKEETFRKFFRLVTHKVSVWYEDHSTKNPNGVVPDPEITRIVRGSKFDDDSVTIVG